MKLQVIDINGKKTNNIELSDKIFSAKLRQNVIRTIVDWQISRFKVRTAKTKQRNEVTGSTAKIYAQKGTGGARHSSRKAPIFVGGGVAHGPKGFVYKVKKINKKTNKLGLLQLLSQKNKVNSLFVVEDFKEEITKTDGILESKYGYSSGTGKEKALERALSTVEKNEGVVFERYLHKSGKKELYTSSAKALEPYSHIEFVALYLKRQKQNKFLHCI